MTLTDLERRELERRSHSRKGRADDARRARCIVLLAEGASWAQIRRQLRCGDSYIARWSQRFATERLAGLYSRHRGQSTTVLTPQLDAKILDWTRRGPQDGTTHWSTRRLAKAPRWQRNCTRTWAPAKLSVRENISRDKLHFKCMY